jgi:hypothetical protein
MRQPCSIVALAVAGLLMGIALPAFAAKRVTVKQLDELLIAAHGKPDGRVAEQLSGLVLTERASSATLSRWETDFPGRRTRDALVALADLSAFLDLPAAEIRDCSVPNPDEQRRIVSVAAEYVSQVIPQLPNFLATRKTAYFEDSPSEQYFNPDLATGGMGLTEYRPLHIVGKSSVAVTYRDGREVVDAEAQKRHKPDTQSDWLTSTGEFGPILAIVVGDAIHGTVAWSHWEQGATGPQAVLHYAVPQEKSRYKVLSPCPAGIKQQFPAYHGEIAVNPADGSILRLTIVADMNPICSVAKANIAVEYGAVAIGGQTYICPVKSVSLSEMPTSEAPKFVQALPPPLKTRLNDVSFVNYHLFRAESRILTGDSVKPPETNP